MITTTRATPAELAYANGYMDGLTTNISHRRNPYADAVRRAEWAAGFARGRRARNGD